MKVLVAFASRHGSTAGIAEAIGKALRGHGLEPDVAEVEKVSSIEAYGAVVLGSAVYAGHVLKPALDFAERFQDDLRRRPVWLFSSGPIGQPPTPSELALDIEPLMKTTAARGHRVFAGKLTASCLNPFVRALVAIARTLTWGKLRRTIRAGSTPGDFRDWQAIGAWADEIAADLVQGGVVAHR